MSASTTAVVLREMVLSFEEQRVRCLRALGTASEAVAVGERAFGRDSTQHLVGVRMRQHSRENLALTEAMLHDLRDLLERAEREAIA